jgi:TetR/AcrR family transcriptional regulator, repressor for uid operon
MLSLAFDRSVPVESNAMSDRILDAALELAAASGLRHLTMDDVARKARVGRMTVYRRFGSRSALVDALAVRECRRCLDTIAASLDPSAPFEDRAATLFTATLKVIREHPLLERLARVEPEALLFELTRNDSEVFGLVREFLISQLRRAQESIPSTHPPSTEPIAGDPAVVAELGVRLGASFVLMPDSVLPLNDEQAPRAAVRALVRPLTVAMC